MVKVEAYGTRSDGVELIRTYSDLGKKLIRSDGVVFDEAVDIKGIGYSYTESDEYIEEISSDEALEILIGGTK